MSGQSDARPPTPAASPSQGFGQNNLRQQLHDQLAKAGYSSINIMPSSFYVQAKNRSGQPVAMVIGPDSFTAVTELNTQAGGNTSSGSSSNAQGKAPPTTDPQSK